MGSFRDLDGPDGRADGARPEGSRLHGSMHGEIWRFGVSSRVCSLRKRSGRTIRFDPFEAHGRVRVFCTYGRRIYDFTAARTFPLKLENHIQPEK